MIVGIDGVRLDTLRASSTPNVDRIAEAGFLVGVRVNDAAPTISGPGWTTILTGVLAPDHGIYDNDLSPNRLEQFPDVVHQVNEARPDVATYVTASWAPLVTEMSGGPVFRGGGIVPATASDGWHDLDEADDLVATGTAAFISDLPAGQDSLSFSYLGNPDEVAHEVGVGPAYVASIERSDARVGRILDAVEGRAAGAAGDWTVIVVTDHGHLDAGGHGGDSDVERTAWIAAAGAGVPTGAGLVGALEQADVAAHTLAVLGVEPAAPAQTIGRPFGARPLGS